MKESFETPVSESLVSEPAEVKVPTQRPLEPSVLDVARSPDLRAELKAQARTKGPNRVHGKFAPALAGSINLGGRGSLEVSDVGITAVGYRTFGGVITFLVVFAGWFAALVGLGVSMALMGYDDVVAFNIGMYGGLFLLGVMFVKFPKIRFGLKPTTRRFTWDNVRFTLATDANPKELIITIDGPDEKGALRFRGDSSIYQFDADLRTLRAEALNEAGLPQNRPLF